MCSHSQSRTPKVGRTKTPLSRPATKIMATPEEAECARTKAERYKIRSLFRRIWFSQDAPDADATPEAWSELKRIGTVITPVPMMYRFRMPESRWNIDEFSSCLFQPVHSRV